MPCFQMIKLGQQLKAMGVLEREDLLTGHLIPEADEDLTGNVLWSSIGGLEPTDFVGAVARTGGVHRKEAHQSSQKETHLFSPDGLE